jgi:predicted secreted protein
MQRRLFPLLAALSLCAALAGCKKDAQIESALAELHTFSQEIVKRVESAPNPSAGVDDAQKYFDSRKGDIESKLSDLKGVRNFQVSEETRKKMTEQLTEDVMSVAKLQIKYIGNSMKDPAFKAKLEKLVNDYQSLLKNIGA